MNRKEFDGRSAAEAAIKACEILGVPRSSLKYELVSDTGAGLENRRVVIAVDMDQAHSQPAPSSGGDYEDDTQPADIDSGYRERPDYDRPREARADNRGGRGGRGGRDGGRGGRGGRGRRDGGRGGRGGRDRDNRRRPRGQGPNDNQRDDGIDALLNLEAFPASSIPMRPEISTPPTARATKAKQVLTDVLNQMKINLTVRLVQDDAEIHFDLRGEGEKEIIGKKGETLLSLQFLINRIVSRQEEGEQHLVLDAAGYRERRRIALADLAKRLATRAVQEKKAVRMSPMSAHDRRIFHITLEEMGGVTTRSEGNGLYRPLLIIPEQPPAQQ